MCACARLKSQRLSITRRGGGRKERKNLTKQKPVQKLLVYGNMGTVLALPAQGSAESRRVESDRLELYRPRGPVRINRQRRPFVTNRPYVSKTREN
ncbi:hypothetical protein EVAR_24476_1 [Eumeta japonica]|uniref:Uncharacterized protein n=1 Tax=Eumeta variegata TaxID=151549 RepID=A0A4C1WWL6_EUMVA|nr:hypothetical protein EVAR_24476_1 [Eumeta japonica]